MGIAALGYVGVGTERLEDWNRFSTGILGMQQVDRARGVSAFRMDDRKQRLIVDSRRDATAFVGWEVVRKDDLDLLAMRLEANGFEVSRGSRALADERFVTDLITFRDPAGNCVEVFWKPQIDTEPFVPGRPITGFKTGPLGMGHAVFHVVDIAPMIAFYRDLLGFAVTDYAHHPNKLYFFHVNQRHHSFAMVETGRTGFHHLMIELFSLDDVGQGYDLAQEAEVVAYTLGRHSNDWMTSFYSQSPSDFFVEYGWGARAIDPEVWEAHETFDGPSYWGHERLYLPDQVRQEMRSMAMDAASRGLRSGEPINCPWLDSVIARE